MRNVVIALLAVAAPATAASQAARPVAPATMPSTMEWMQSRAVADSFAVHIALPARYNVDSTARYGVLVVLDADKSFGLARDIVDWLSWPRVGGGEITPLIVVGVAYGRGEPEWWSKRSRDMTPSPDRGRVYGNWPLAGGGPAFHQFLRDELLPRVDQRFRTDPQVRVLAGLSFGGLFAVWSMFAERPVFTHIIAVNPALAWDSLSVAAAARRGASRATPMNVMLYSAVGALDDEATIRRPWATTMATLDSLGGVGVRVTKEVLPGETHISSWPTGLVHGLKALVARPPR